ncbi:hypothetical protein F5882DRAFT_435638 [Hyaloscypha sp. PMI_1271]|nr:hypothetical protein F5882DRAFT_435638 [Hyaloscypha sp. PMI_1271]
MRLLNTTTLKLHEFFGSEIPYYAILSHRWGADEVTFQDLQQGRGPTMAGWAKIVGCSSQARKEGWEYAVSILDSFQSEHIWQPRALADKWQWIDSCCIDKSSSAELSEAINSMFQWYRNSQVCYAYLVDVPTEEEDHWGEGSSFRMSEWFTRGWTLQELLAPDAVFFFNREGFEAASVAQKFSWASKRRTLRVEDTAYCLMGLFRVHMPLLYGEGNDAFTRLQLEIMKISDDDSLFAWTYPTDPFDTQRIQGNVLANMPADFHGSGNVYVPPSASRSSHPYSMTNKGLSISVVLLPAAEVLRKAGLGFTHEIGTFNPDNLFFAPLSCCADSIYHVRGRHAKQKHILLPLSRVTQGTGYIWHRPDSYQLHGLSYFDIPWERKKKQIFLPRFQYVFPIQRNAIADSDFPKIAISAGYFFSNGFAISSVTDHGRPHPVSITRWLPPDNDAHDCTLIIPGYHMVLVEFKDMTNPAECQDSFVLGIDRNLLTTGPFGVFLLPPNGKPFNEIVGEAREYQSHKSCDRDAIALPSGHMISVALRKRVRDGKLMYAVDFDVRLSSSIRNLAVERYTPPQEILSLTTSIERTN